jgi:uncharacterized protein
MLNPKTFKCETCGECCIKYIVKLSKQDIEKIKKLGYSEFFERDEHISSFVLKKNDNGCVFLDKDSSCKIYNDRPSVCKMYPFMGEDVSSCKPVTFESR